MTVLTPIWLQDSAYSAELDRQVLAASMMPYGPYGVRSGVLFGGYVPVINGDGTVNEPGTYITSPPAPFRVLQSTVASMQLQVYAGRALIAGGNTLNQGAYLVVNDATINITIGSSNSTNPRIDLVVLEVADAAYQGGTSFGRVRVVPGTAASSPVVPATPVNSIALARVLVSANVTTISEAAITDTRPFTAFRGEQVKVRTAAERATVVPYLGMQVFELSTNRIYEWRNYWHLIGGYPPIVTGYRIGAGSIPGNTWFNIGIEATRGDPWSIVQGGGFFTAWVKGVYRFSGVIAFQASGVGGRGIRFVLNQPTNGPVIAGSSQVISNAGGGLYTVVSSPISLLNMNVGDSIIMQGYHNAGANLGVIGTNEEASQNTFVTFELAYQTGT